MPVLRIDTPDLFHSEDETNLGIALDSVNEGTVVTPRFRVKCQDGLKFLDVHVVMGLDGRTPLVSVTFMGNVVVLTDATKNTLSKLSFVEDERVDLRRYSMTASSLPEQDYCHIVPAILEVLERKTHWCVTKHVYRDRYIMAQKAPEQVGGGIDQSPVTLRRWNICVRQLSGPNSMEVWDIIIDDEFVSQYLSGGGVLSGCKFLSGLEFAPFQDIAYCDVSVNSWAEAHIPIWFPYRPNVSKLILDTVRALDRSDEDNRKRTLTTNREGISIKVIEHAKTLYIAQVEQRPGNPEWTHRPVGLCARTRHTVESFPVQVLFEDIPAVAPSGGGVGSKRGRED